MADDDKAVTATTDVPTVHVVAISPTGTPDGLTLAVQTPGSSPNLVVTYITPVAALLIRFVYLFLTTELALVTAGMTTQTIPAHDFVELARKCGELSLTVAGYGAIKDAVTLFTRLKAKFPMLEA